MALSKTFAIVWLDTYISARGQYQQLKSTFQAELAPVAAAVPVDPIDQLIVCIRETCAPVIFAPTVEETLSIIERLVEDNKFVVLITSGSLGSVILPEIQRRSLTLHSYYIFCANMTHHAEWVLEYLDQGLEIQMFDFEITLLTRLARDLSNELIKQGNELLNTDPLSALNYFQCARVLAENAVARDMSSNATDLHRPSTKHREILDGENGLIAQAQRACNRNNV
ncbi:unnamed protein product [Adineta ricciae]|uniref:Uncharacterized protein n=1 Tax=Adineta ricciae TaxID=249248 RepID=A0A813PRI2_ADIRI|nr:unnamed protein product [Adineta ricciae]CAF0854718.1 unnamed protein product [Adineta ricciae]